MSIQKKKASVIIYLRLLLYFVYNFVKTTEKTSYTHTS